MKPRPQNLYGLSWAGALGANPEVPEGVITTATDTNITITETATTKAMAIM